MASRKLLRDFVLSKKPFFHQLRAPHKISLGSARLPVIEANGYSYSRQFSLLNEFSEKVKGEVNRSQEFQQSVKTLKEKAEELKGAKEGLKARTKQTTEELYKRVDGVWTDAEATAKKMYANVEEKISSAKEEVKENFGIGKQQSAGSSGTSEQSGFNANENSQSANAEEKTKQEQKRSSDTAETVFSRVKSAVSSASSKVSPALQKLKEAKPVDLAKKGFAIVKDELKGNPGRRKRIEYEAPADSPANIPKSTVTDVAVLPQSKWSKKWETLKEKMQAHPLFKRISGYSEPVVQKSQEIAEEVRERWETSDHPVVNKIQDINESVFGETSTAVSVKEIRRRDPSFSLPEFVAEVQEIIKPVLRAYLKGDVEVLKKYCSPEVIERCKAERKAFESNDIFFDNKIIHVSEVEVRETKMMGESPIIILAFQTQQVHCIRDRHGSVREGGKDTIHTVYYAWAMQQVDPEELGESSIYPLWRLREMQQFGVQALI